MSADAQAGDQTKQSSTKRGVLKSAATMTVLTFISRILGLVREQLRGYFLGTGMSSDAFGLASTIPNLFRRLLAEGAMTAAFVPVFTSYLKEERRKELASFFSAFLSLFTLVTTLVVIVGILFSDWIVVTFFSEGFGKVPGKLSLTIVLTRLMFPYLGLVSFAAIVQAVLNSFYIFGPGAFTPILLNLCIITLAALFHDFFPDPSYAFAAGFLLGGALQIGFQLPWFFRQKLKLSFSLNWKHPGVRELVRIFIPGTFAAGIYQVNVFISEMIASTLSPGSIAALQYSIRLQELILGVFVISMTTVILPTLSRLHSDGDAKGFGTTNLFSLEVLGLITIPASFFLIALRKPVVILLFQHGAFDEHSTTITSFAVLFHSFGIYFIAISRSLNQAFYAMKDLKTPMLISGAAALVNIAGCYLLSIPLSHGGIALANSLSALTSTVLMYILLSRRGVDMAALKYGRFIARLMATGLLALAAMTLFDYFVYPLQDGAGKREAAIQLGLEGAVGIAVFFAAALVLLRSELRSVVELLRTRGRS